MSSAFALRAEYDGTVTHEDGTTVPVYTGGVLAIPDGRSYDVREALDQGNGTIVVPDDDHLLSLVLSEYPALKSVPAPEKPSRRNRADTSTAGDAGKES